MTISNWGQILFEMSQKISFSREDHGNHGIFKIFRCHELFLTQTALERRIPVQHLSLHYELRNSFEVENDTILEFFGERGFFPLFQEYLAKEAFFLEGDLSRYLVFMDGENAIRFNREFMPSLEEEGQDQIEIQILSLNGEGIKVAKEFAKTYCQEIIDSRPRGSIHVIVPSISGYQFIRAGTGGSPFISENYSPQVSEEFKIISHSLCIKNPEGRLTILSGPPGTGKTHFIRGILDTLPEGMFVLIPPTMVQNLGDPGLVSVFLKHKMKQDREHDPLILILEDADECLIVRGSDNIGHISALLNLSDGILGAVLDLRVIASTNGENLRIDKALKRPGRLQASVDFGDLQPEEGKKIFLRLTGKEPDSSLPKDLAGIYHEARRAGFPKESEEIKNEMKTPEEKPKGSRALWSYYRLNRGRKDRRDTCKMEEEGDGECL